LATIPHGEAETATKIYMCHIQATKYYTASKYYVKERKYGECDQYIKFRQ